MPAGREDEAGAFYEGLLGIPRVPKPALLAARGGCWFERGDLKIHLGVDSDFHPARKAHPALVVDGLPALVERLRTAGATLRDDEPLEGHDRVFVDDPFGNRIELLEPHRSIAFRPLAVDDFDQLGHWFAEPDVARWWNQPADPESVAAKYAHRIDGTDRRTQMWVAEVDGEPAGLVQSYLHADHPEHDLVVGLADAIGIDYLVGATHRGRGLGAVILREFAGFVFGLHLEAMVCVATPAVANIASCAALERAGFVRNHACQPPNEPPAVVYALARAAPPA